MPHTISQHERPIEDKFEVISAQIAENTKALALLHEKIDATIAWVGHLAKAPTAEAKTKTEDESATHAKPVHAKADKHHAKD